MLGSILRQILQKDPELYQFIKNQVESQSPISPGNPIARTVPTLWTYVLTLWDHLDLPTIYCFLDGLDECDDQSTLGFLKSFRATFDSKLPTKRTVKFFITSRNDIHSMGDLYATAHYFQVYVQPSFIRPDIKRVIERELNDVAGLLNLNGEQKNKVKDLLEKRADGMFQWVCTASKEIGEASDITFQDLIALINALPLELYDLYNESLLRLVRSLDKRKINRITQTLTWLLLARRPLTIREMSFVLAIQDHPERKRMPGRYDLPLSIGTFIHRYLAPFVEVVSDNPESSTNIKLEDCLTDPEATIKFVHKSAQEFLYKVCTSSEDRHSLPGIHINPQQGHENIAKVIYTCLKSDECQVGWLGPKLSNATGHYLGNEISKQLLEAKLRANSFLSYAVRQRSYHVRRCQSRGKDDMFDATIDFFCNYPPAMAFMYQLSQYVAQPERSTYWPMAPVLTFVAASASVPLFERFLNRCGVNDIDECDRTRTPSLIDVCAAESSDDFPEEAVEIARKLLDLGANPSAVDTLGRTAIHYAAIHGRVELLDLIIKQRGNLEIREADGDTPLHFAVDHGQSNAARILIEAGADKEKQDREGCTPLHCATRYGHTEIVHMLLEEHATTDPVDQDDWTPLHYASANGHQEIVEALLGHGASINSKTKDAITPIHLAVHNEHREIVSKLLEFNADGDIVDVNGTGPLHASANNGDMETVRLLLDSGVNIDSQNDDGWTALHIAASKSDQNMVDLLLERHANVDLKKKEGDTAIHLAAAKNCVGVLRQLLQAGALVGSKTGDGENALHWAAAQGATECAGLLLEKGVPVDEENSLGQTPLLIAAENNASLLMKLLIRYKANVNHLSKSLSWTALHVAAHGGHYDALQELLENGARVDEQGYAKKPTALHLAAQEGHLRCCELLVHFGATVSLVDTFEQTPLWLALKKGQMDVCRFLLPQESKFTNKDSSLLHVAFSEGHVDIASLLLTAGAPIDYVDEHGYTPLQTGLAARRTDVCKMLLESERISKVDDTTFSLGFLTNDAEVVHLLLQKLDVDDINNNLTGQLALYAAAREGNLDLIKLLLHHGVDGSDLLASGDALLKFQVSERTADVVEYLMGKQILDPHRYDTDGWTIIHYGALSDSCRVLDVCRKNSVDFGTLTKSGKSALHIWAGSGKSSAVLEHLLNSSLRSQINGKDEEGWTPLHIAARAGNGVAFELLLQIGADISSKTNDGETIYHLGARNNTIFPRLLESQTYVPVNDQDKEGVTVLHRVSKHSDKKTVGRILSFGANIAIPDKFGRQALHYAVSGCNGDVVRLLLQNKASVRAEKDANTLTGTPSLLHLAAMVGDESIFFQLLAAGAEYRADMNGWTPIDVAHHFGFFALKERIMRHRAGRDKASPLDRMQSPSAWSQVVKSDEILLRDGNCEAELSGL